MNYNFEGFVEKIRIESWGAEIVVRSEFDETGLKFPQRLLFTVSSKSMGKIPEGLSKNDMVSIIFTPYLREGITKATKKPYTAMVLFLNELELVSKYGTNDMSASGEPEDEDPTYGLPF